MKFIDFFAGIGGFRRGMELAGHTCAGFCEQDEFAAASYTSMHLITEGQRGKKPIKNEYNHECCPNCGWIVYQEEWGGRYLPHCENCGQAIDRGDSDD